MRGRETGAAIAVAGLLTPAAPAMASWDDALELSVAQAITNDDNVFRIASEVDPGTVLGSPSRGDTYHTTTFGLKLDLPVSRQRVVAELKLNRYRYDRFDILDLDGHHGQAAWHWQAGERLNGRLGYADTQILASLANVQSGVQSSIPNFLDTSQRLFDATLRLTERWQIHGEFHSIRHENSADEFSVSDATIDSARLELGYATPAGSRFGIGLLQADGHLPNPQLVAGVPVDNDYRHEGIDAFVEWMTSSHSRLTVRAGPVRREFRELPQRDFDDWTWRVGFDWLPMDKLLLGASFAKEVSMTDQVNVGFVLVEGPAFTATWKPAEKLDVTLELQRADREYLGEAAIALGLTPPRSEQFESAAARISYRPTRLLTIELGLRHERRDSTVVLGDFKATVAGIGFRLAF